MTNSSSCQAMGKEGYPKLTMAVGHKPKSPGHMTAKLTGGNGAQRNCRPCSAP